MAEIDPRIALGVQPIQIESPINRMNAFAQLQGAQQQAQMNALKMQEYQQQVQDRNALAKLMNDPTLEFGSDAFMQQVQKRAPTMYEGIASRVAARENLLAQKEARQAETEKRAFEVKKYERQLKKEDLDQAMSDIAGFNDLASIRADIDRKVAAGTLSEQMAEQVRQGLPVDDEGVPDWKRRTLLSLLSAKDRLVEERETARGSREEARLKLEDARVQEQQRHQKEMEAISRSGVDRQERQLKEQQRHNQAMERLDARRVETSERAEKRKQEMGDVNLSQKEIQKREAAFPQASAAIKGVEAKSDSFIKDLQDLANHPGLSQITGLIAGRVPGVTADARAAQALYDKIMARGGFQALQEMRDMSKTGGALGNVSNQEGKQLQASFAAIDRRQDAADVKKAIEQAIADIEGAKTRMREAYNETYSYRSSQGGASGGGAPAAPPAPAPRQLSAQDQAALDWANANPNDARSRTIKQRLGVK